MHHGNFEAAEDALNIAKRTFHDGSAVVLNHLAGTQLMLGKVDEAKLTLEEAVGSETLSAENLQRMMDFYSTDGGGEYFKTIWIELENL
jgi:hypothetical protein